MKITFCGHSEINGKPNLDKDILRIIGQEAENRKVTFYLGSYGDFDARALSACKEYKQIHPDALIYFITPYLDESYLSGRKLIIENYDGTIYPPLEKVPKKFAIIERNKWMIAQSDLVISYVDYPWGGAANALSYAYKLKKRFINLGGYVPKN